MTAVISYQIIKTLPDNEWNLLMDMLDRDRANFKIENLFSDKKNKKEIDFDCISFLIKNHFSKITKK